MTAHQLILKQRAELLAVLCGGGSAEPLDCVLDLLLACEVLVWEDYLSIRVVEKPLCSNVRQLFDVVYDKGEDACSLLLAAMNQVLPEEQKAGLCFGKECAVLGKNRPDTATLTLLADRPVLVRKLRDNIDGALNALLTTGCFTIKDCDAVQLPVYTPSQQVRRLLDQVRFKGETAAKTLLQYLEQTETTRPNPEDKENHLSANCLLYQKKLRSSVAAQSHSLSTYGGTGRFSLDDIYTDGLLEVMDGSGETLTLGLEDVVGPLGTLNEDADTVLVSGEAGSGKSTLLQRLHLLWAREALLTNTFLLFPFSCRKLNSEHRELSLKELLFLHCCWPDRSQDEVFQFILDHPNLALFTFDGLDEFKQGFTDEERHCCPTKQVPIPILLFNLLQGTLMKGVMKVATSRPQAVGPSLKHYLRKEVLLKGFSPGGIDCYVKKHHSDPAMARRVIESLQANTVLLSLCHIPVFCWIVTKCHQELLGGQDVIPQTITDVSLLVLQHFFQRKSPQPQGVLGKAWLEEHLDTVLKLGQLALEGLEASCYVFSGYELQRNGLTEQDVSLGFLIYCNDLSVTDCKRYEFLHITLQCFFAALYVVLNRNSDRSAVSRLFQPQYRQLSGLSQRCLGHCIDSSVEEVESHVTETPNLQITAQFVSGLLSQRHHNLLLECCPTAVRERKVKQVVKSLSKGMQRHFKSIPRPVEGEKKSMHAMPSFVWLIKCIYEMQDNSIAQDTMAKLDVEHLKLTYCNIGPVECTALSYVLKYLRNPVGLQLDNNSVGDVGAEQLLPCLHICHSLYLRNNNISDEGIRKLLEKGMKCESFQKIALFNNNLTDACTQHFALLLKSKQNFLSLRLGNNNITSQGAEQLAEGLSYNQSLQFLGLWGNKIGDRGAEALAAALKNSTTLIWLSLVDNGVGSAGACALAKLISQSKTLEQLWLNKNCISREGVECLIEALKMNSSVKEVWLRGNNLSPEEEEELSKQESRLTF
ncbi:nucleotide-binding oligomerization domain-containing protein 2-like isoform X1 [Sinocyclocheilus anshuiensis]|uniref:Nucleotide-binding oligomerization domain-containing protein 2-like n=1 Tax=Sinocyclocheilus anshuiensis TaxID=1608454 RepID=A0A671RA91_9TELE|nr:PREDICTED: nucleotide-binding oligomerization domain-containing protein 2-like isoform X1 [Sinocyclocheilus anshuiensis]XP_016352661.1 PREDICTED: nucleotide-binding oligomerization domain-containing protein 2-like isoform X1 [Sinocyclocheilus anshuiensis]